MNYKKGNSLSVVLLIVTPRYIILFYFSVINNSKPRFFKKEKRLISPLNLL